MPDAEFNEARYVLLAAGFSEDEARERLSCIDTFERKSTSMYARAVLPRVLLEQVLEDACAGTGEGASSSSGAV
jgi:hypothetical protein